VAFGMHKNRTGRCRSVECDSSLPDAVRCCAAFAVQQSRFDWSQLVAREVHLFGDTLPSHLVILAQHGRGRCSALR
jgi:hypothetical protein